MFALSNKSVIANQHQVHAPNIDCNHIATHLYRCVFASQLSTLSFLSFYLIWDGLFYCRLQTLSCEGRWLTINEQKLHPSPIHSSYQLDEGLIKTEDVC